MSKNFNMEYDSNAGLTYVDVSGETVSIGKGKTTTLSYIAPVYSKKTYPAKSLVTQYGSLYYNPSAINTAENWTPAHWTACTVASYIAALNE